MALTKTVGDRDWATEWYNELNDYAVNGVDLNSVQTLTNKTLTTPTINGATISGTFTGDLDITGGFTAGGDVGIGIATPDTQLHLKSTSENILTLETSVSSAGEYDLDFVKSRSDGVITTGDRIGRMKFRAHDGTDTATTAAEIRVVSAGTIASNQIPAYMVFDTMDTSGVKTERMRITDTGNLTLTGGITVGENQSINLSGTDNTSKYDHCIFTRGSDNVKFWTDGDGADGIATWGYRDEGNNVLLQYSKATDILTLTGSIIAGGGYISLQEITTPTATANYGKIYTKTDNKVYFQDGAGTEHEIAFV